LITSDGSVITAITFISLPHFGHTSVHLIDFLNKPRPSPS
jgi:hypothetical protein